jgi:hypothetical protein
MFSKKAVAILLIVLSLSCKDSGTNPSNNAFSASSTNVNVVKGSTAIVTLSAGVIPYLIQTQPSSAKATASISSATLTITGVDTGSTSIKLNDSQTPTPSTITLSITVALTAAQVSFSGQVQPIFNTNCASCHGSSGGLSLSSTNSYSSLVNIQAQSSCTSLMRVLPNDPANSVLYKKVSSTSCGTQMPSGGTLSASDIALIRDWISQGAKNN